MNPSLLARAPEGAAGQLKTIPIGELSAYVRSRGIYPSDGRAVSVPSGAMAALLRSHTLADIETRINDLTIRLKRARAGRDAEQAIDALSEAFDAAETSREPHELRYLAGMFIHEPAVMRRLAANPALPEETQAVLAADPVLGKDRALRQALAHNPGLTPAMMGKLLGKEPEKFVLQGIAATAALKSRQSAERDSPYAAICEILAANNFDVEISKTAFRGVKNPEFLRNEVERLSPLLAADKLLCIAENPNTPDDALAKMASSRFPVLHKVVNWAFADKAARVLADRQQQAATVEIGAT